MTQTNHEQAANTAFSGNTLRFESFGVRVLIESNDKEAIAMSEKVLIEALPRCHRMLPGSDSATHRFTLEWNKDGVDSIYKDGEPIALRIKREKALEILGPQLRLTVAEHAVGRVFVHAGTVSWRDKAILIPGKSFSGKTTLTAELVKRGAVYYSDEYAVIDYQGFVHPFPKPLSIRTRPDDATQVEHDVEVLGGRSASGKSEIAMVLVTEYKPNAKWRPEVLSPARGVMEMIKNTASIRTYPTPVLDVLGQVARSSTIVKSPRGEASRCVEPMLAFFETNCLGSSPQR